MIFVFLISHFNVKTKMKKKSSMRSLIRRSKEDTLLLKAAKQASSKAIRSSFALGLSVKHIENQIIVETSPEGSRVVRKIKPANHDTSTLKKGMVLVRK
jgi:hypothetical protein